MLMKIFVPSMLFFLTVQTYGSQQNTLRISECAMLTDAKEYVGKLVVINGVLTSREHGMFLQVHPNCPSGVIRVESHDKIPWSAYKQAGGAKDRGVLATVSGRIILSKKTNLPVLSISSVTHLHRLSRTDQTK